MIESISIAKSRLNELEERERRLLAIMPVFQEARDAITVITEHQRRLHNISIALADKMDELGEADKWKELDTKRLKETNNG